MQTFLPYADFGASARALDNQRLGKQRVECLQLLNVLSASDRPRKGWRNHPACKMWEHHCVLLATYGQVVCAEWKARGFKDTCSEKIAQVVMLDAWDRAQLPGKPAWLGDERLHASHRSNLMRKAWDSNDDVLDWYLAFDWKDDPDADYWWPV